MTTQEWLYISESMLGVRETIGPIPERELLGLIHQGKLKRESLVSSPTRTSGNWCQIQQLPGLVAALEKGEAERELERQRKAQAKEAERQARAAERQAAAAAREAEAQRRAEASERDRALAAQRRMQLDAARAAAFTPRDYPAMSIIITLLYVMAALIACSFILHVLFTVLAIVGVLGEGSGLGVFALLAGLVMSFLAHGMFVLVFIASAESIRIIIDIQVNTQETAFYTHRLAGHNQNVIPVAVPQ
jgi:hypothetical protein